jgi:methionyl-tRNA formyltransferase
MKLTVMKPKILYMGTAAFAVPSLKILVENNYPIIGVVTQPDRPKGRGQHLKPPPVKVYAEGKQIPIYQPEKVKNEDFLKLFGKLDPEMVVLTAFGQILPEEIIEGPKYGCINVHPSLLPKYRGAAPVNWTLIQGEEKTGVTIIQMDKGIDSGDILLQEEIFIKPHESFGELNNRLSIMGAELLLKTISMILSGTVIKIPQDNSVATYAPRLHRESGLIHWNTNINQIVNLIRGLSPVPCAYTFVDGKKLKIFEATGEEAPVNTIPGTIIEASEKAFKIKTKDRCLSLIEVQLESKKKMYFRDFLRGYHIETNKILG